MKFTWHELSCNGILNIHVNTDMNNNYGKEECKILTLFVIFSSSLVLIVNLIGKYRVISTLPSINNILYNKNDVEIVYVDDGSTDNSLEFNMHSNFST